MTYDDIARRAGVSTATVSRVLSGSGIVSEERRRRVLDAVDALSYRSNRAAKTLRRRRSDTIGLIVSDLEYPFVSSFARAVENEAAAQGFAVLVCNTDEDLERERFYYGLMIEEQVAGVIIAPATEDIRMVQPLVDARVPIVTFDRRFPDDPFDSVLLDNASATGMLLEDLLRHGHRQFAAVIGTTTATPSRERLEAMRAVLDGVPDATLTVIENDLHGTVGVDHALETIGPAVLDRAERMPQRPTAFVCANAIIVMSVLSALGRNGFSVPGDAAVVGYDDVPGFDLFATPVTVVNQPTAWMGATAVARLVERLDRPDAPATATLAPPFMRHRASCGPR